MHDRLRIGDWVLTPDLHELVRGDEHRVLRPNGLLYWGQYGGVHHAGPLERDHYEPKRFFSFLADAALKTAGGVLFRPVSFEAIAVDPDWEQHFQSSVWRKS